MHRRFRTTLWLSRGLLVVPIALFGFIGWRYLASPVSTAGVDGIALGSPASVTDMRVMAAMFELVLFTLFLVGGVSEWIRERRERRVVRIK
jgi:hypothetical protein